MGEVYITDISLNKPIKVASIPSALNTYSTFNSTLNANSQYWVRWTTTPTLPQTSIWNVAVGVRFGTNSAAYNWPDGASLTNNQQLVQVMVMRQAINSNVNEASNRIVHTVMMRNGSADSFAFYMYFKTWTFATSIGTSA